MGRDAGSFLSDLPAKPPLELNSWPKTCEPLAPRTRAARKNDSILQYHTCRNCEPSERAPGCSDAQTGMRDNARNRPTPRTAGTLPLHAVQQTAEIVRGCVDGHPQHFRLCLTGSRTNPPLGVSVASGASTRSSRHSLQLPRLDLGKKLSFQDGEEIRPVMDGRDCGAFSARCGMPSADRFHVPIVEHRAVSRCRHQAVPASCELEAIKTCRRRDGRGAVGNGVHRPGDQQDCTSSDLVGHQSFRQPG